MLGFQPIASAPIAALSDELTTVLSASFTGTVTFSALPFSPYQALLTSGNLTVVTVEINLRAVR